MSDKLYGNHRLVRCNMCMNVFDESEIIYDGDEDEEYCPYCGEAGALMDLTDDEGNSIE